MSVRHIPLLYRHQLEVLLLVETAETAAVGTAGTANGETLAVHFDAAGFFASAASFLLFGLGGVGFEGEAEGVLFFVVVEEGTSGLGV